MRPQAEQGGPGGGEDNGFNLKGAARARAASGGWKDQPHGQLGAPIVRCWKAIGQNILSSVLYPSWGAVINTELVPETLVCVGRVKLELCF